MDRNLTKKYSLGSCLFIFAFSIYLLSTIINASFYARFLPPAFMKHSMVLVVLILVTKEILLKKIKIKELALLLTAIFLSYLIFRNLSGQIAILPLFVFIYSSRNVDLDKIMRTAYYISLVLFLVIFISAKLGVITNYIEDNGRFRDYLGFRYSLYGSVLLFNITALDLYLHRRHVGLVRCLVWVIANVLVFKLTDSRLAFYLSVLLIMLSYIACRYKSLFEKRAIVKRLLCISFILIPIFSICITYKYDPNNSYHSLLNEALGNRLYYGKAAIEEYGINMFGHDITFVGNGLDANGDSSGELYNYVDCLYVMLLLRYGIMFMALLMIMLTITCCHLYRKKEYYLLFLMAILAVHGVVDDLIIFLYFNSFWLIIGKVVLDNKTTEGRKEVIAYV